MKRWILPALLLLAFIVVPFVLFEQGILARTREFLDSPRAKWATAAGVAALLAGDIVLPIPSSLVSTASGSLLGFWVGAIASWTGMTAACLLGYWLGRRALRRPAASLVGERELERVSNAQARFGDWAIVVCRAVPVLAEASVLIAGLTGMRWGHFMTLTALSNLGVSCAYAAVGAYAMRVESFLAAFAGALLVPALAMLAARGFGRRR